jgi:hypothetical protein
MPARRGVRRESERAWLRVLARNGNGTHRSPRLRSGHGDSENAEETQKTYHTLRQGTQGRESPSGTENTEEA